MRGTFGLVGLKGQRRDTIWLVCGLLDWIKADILSDLIR